MTREDYIAIADVINSTRLYFDGHSRMEVPIKMIAERLSQVLKQNNPHFDRIKFLKACGCVDGL